MNAKLDALLEELDVRRKTVAPKSYFGILPAEYDLLREALREREGMVKMPSYADISGAVARGWRTPRNAHKGMDSDLASSIVVEVHQMLVAAEGK